MAGLRLEVMGDEKKQTLCLDAILGDNPPHLGVLSCHCDFVVGRRKGTTRVAKCVQEAAGQSTLESIAVMTQAVFFFFAVDSVTHRVAPWLCCEWPTWMRVRAVPECSAARTYITSVRRSTAGCYRTAGGEGAMWSLISFPGPGPVSRDQEVNNLD